MKIPGRTALAAGVLAAGMLAAGAAHAEVLERLQLTVSGGVGGYSGRMGAAVRPGGTWELRGEAPVLRHLAVGFAYAGSANQLGPASEAAPPLLVRSAARLNVRLFAGENLQPYVEAGAGPSLLSVHRAAPGLGFRDALGAELPVAAGLRTHAGLVSAGVRVGYHVLLGSRAWAGGRGDLWSGSLELGANF